MNDSDSNFVIRFAIVIIPTTCSESVYLLAVNRAKHRWTNLHFPMGEVFLTVADNRTLVRDKMRLNQSVNSSANASTTGQLCKCKCRICNLQIDGLEHKPFKSGQADFTER